MAAALMGCKSKGSRNLSDKALQQLRQKNIPIVVSQINQQNKAFKSLQRRFALFHVDPMSCVDATRYRRHCATLPVELLQLPKELLDCVLTKTLERKIWALT